MEIITNIIIYILKVIAGASTLPVFALTAHYIFNMPKPRHKYILHILTAISASGFIFDFGEDYLLTYIVIPIYLLYCTKFNIIYTLYLIISVLGLTTGIGLLTGISSLLPYHLKILVAIYEEYYLILFLTAFLLVKSLRENLDLIRPYRKNNIKQMVLINFITLTQLKIFDVFCTFDMKPEAMTKNALTICTALMSMVLSITIIAVVIQFRKKSITNTIADLSNRYLNAEVEHFKAYEKTQIETRRIRHDMKNHLFSLEHLLKEGNTAAAKDFIHSLKDSVDTLETELQTGNTLADAICNDKLRIADSYGIKFSIDGSFPKNMQIENVDLCTILGNSLDNAIEATNNLNTGDKWIEMAIKTQGNMLYLSFSNPIDTTPDKKLQKIFRKIVNFEKNFSLHNIKYTLKKYKGYMDVDLINENDTNIYVLNNMLIYT